MEAINPTGSNLQAIAARTIESFVDRRLDHSELFADGALIEERVRRYEPPTDKAVLTRHLHRYLEAKVDERTLIFQNAREGVKTQAEWYAKGWGPPPHPNAANELRKMADEIIELRLRLDELSEQLPETKAVKKRGTDNSYAVATSNRVLNAIKQLPNF